MSQLFAAVGVKGTGQCVPTVGVSVACAGLAHSWTAALTTPAGMQMLPGRGLGRAQIQVRSELSWVTFVLSLCVSDIHPRLSQAPHHEIQEARELLRQQELWGAERWGPSCRVTSLSPHGTQRC